MNPDDTPLTQAFRYHEQLEDLLEREQTTYENAIKKALSEVFK